MVLRQVGKKVVKMVTDLPKGKDTTGNLIKKRKKKKRG